MTTSNKPGKRAPKKSLGARFIAYMIENKPDLLFRILRNTRPNLVTPNNGPVFITRFRDVEEALSRPEVFNITYAAMVGGIETTSQAIVQILEQLFKRPAIFKQAVTAAKMDDDDLVFQYCWEALRFNPINPFVVRRCARNYKIASGSLRSATIKEGAIVLVSTRSAMRDGREIPAASHFCIDRPPHHYMHLGYGLHSCLGDQLSRVQVPEIIKRLLKLPNLRPGSSIDLNGGPFPESYTVEFDPIY